MNYLFLWNFNWIVESFINVSMKLCHFSIIKLFASNKDDKRRVEKALDISGLPSGKNDSILQNKFQFEDFYELYRKLTERSEVKKIFEEL